MRVPEGFVARRAAEPAADDARSGAAAGGFRRPSGPVRSFVALPCPSGLRTEVAEARREWRETPADVKWADPAQIHLTLRFLGDASPAALEDLHERLEATARRTDPVTLVPGETGAFPGWSRARVLWVGFEDVDDGAIARLSAAVEGDARAAGFEPVDRPFVPHLTLGRVKGREARAAIEPVRRWRAASGAEEVEEMVLFESQLGPGGAIHTPLARYTLGGSR